MCSGITSASTASRAFAANLGAGFGLELPNAVVMLIGMGFMLLVMAVNFRGVSESVKTNVVLTLVELSGLVMVILIGFWAIAGGNADFSRVVMFDTPEDKTLLLSISRDVARLLRDGRLRGLGEHGRGDEGPSGSSRR